MSSLKVTAVTRPMILGDGPHWVPEDQSLLFVDYSGKTINRYHAEKDSLESLKLEGSNDSECPSFIIPVENHRDFYMVGVGHDLCIVEWPQNNEKPSNKTKVHSFDTEHPTNGLNDAKCDPSGRLWAGTNGFESTNAGKLYIDMNKAGLYRIERGLETSKQISEISMSNGLTWSNDSKIFYYIDTQTLRIDAFDYEDSTGKICNRRKVFDLKENGFIDHYPDGMTIDLDGNLWVACYNGGKVLNINPKLGRVLRQVDLPSIYTTSCCFGGPDFSTLFVTSGTRNMTTEALKQNPEAGKTFAVTGLGIKGSPHRSFEIEENLIKSRS